MTDPVEQFLGRPLSSYTTSLSNAAAPQYERSVRGLKELAKKYAWGSVLELATSLISDHEDAIERAAVANAVGDQQPRRSEELSSVETPLVPHELLLCEAFRGIALVQTRRVDRAKAYLDELGSLLPDNPNYRYESFPKVYPCQGPGCFVPYELAALAIEIRVRHGEATAILDCYDLLLRFPDHETSILSSLVGYHIRAQQFDTATDIARELAIRQGASVRALFVYMRVLLHVGDFDEAGRILNLIHERGDAPDDLLHVHKGLLLSARGNFDAALVENDWVTKLDCALDHVRVAANANAAICLIHLGRLAEAMARVEACLREDPEKALDEGLVFNLCTMYDLAFPDLANEKKSILHKLATRFGRQGFNLDSITAQ